MYGSGGEPAPENEPENEPENDRYDAPKTDPVERSNRLTSVPVHVPAHGLRVPDNLKRFLVGTEGVNLVSRIDRVRDFSITTAETSFKQFCSSPDFSTHTTCKYLAKLEPQGNPVIDIDWVTAHSFALEHKADLPTLKQWQAAVIRHGDPLNDWLRTDSSASRKQARSVDPPPTQISYSSWEMFGSGYVIVVLPRMEGKALERWSRLQYATSRL